MFQAILVRQKMLKDLMFAKNQNFENFKQDFLLNIVNLQIQNIWV